MTQFNLFDQIELTEPIALISDFSNAIEEKDVADIGTVGAIVEVLEEGEAFLVELFGDLVKVKDPEGLIRATSADQDAFRETLGVETVLSNQMRLRHRSNIVKVELFRLLDQMPEDLLQEVQTFAKSLQH